MAAFLCAAGLSACAGAPSLQPAAPHTSSFAASTAPTYEIQAEDKLKLVVFGEEAISGDYTVSKDGLIHVAQVGSVKAAGLTIEQLQGELVKRLSNGIVDNPQVSLIVADDGS